MNESSKNGYAYLNREGRWLDFTWDGLELRPDGALQLYSLPLLEGALPDSLADLAAPDGPAGIAVDADGTIFWSDPATHRVIRLDGCDQTQAPVPCVGGEGDRPGRLNTPRGLLIPSHRKSLFVADSGNHRIEIFDLGSFQLVGIWGQGGAEDEPTSGAAPGRFHTPWALAGDRAGNVYVVDYGNRRVQKFNYAGDVIPSFWHAMSGTGTLSRPIDIAVYAGEGAAELYVIDAAANAIFVFDPQGQVVRDDAGQPVSFGAEHLRKPLGIAVAADAVYVGDNELRRVLKFKRGGSHHYIGEAVGYQGPVSALALDDQGNLLVHSGTDLTPVRLSVHGGYRTRGVLFSGAITVRDFEVTWHRLAARLGQLTAGSHLRLFVYTANDENEAPAVDPAADSPFADGKWRPRPVLQELSGSLTDLLIGGAPAKYLWIGVLFSGDGKASPVLSQLRVEFDHETYAKSLPAIYRGDDPCADFLRRFVSLFETLNVEVEGLTRNLPALFDPQAVPARYLPWLAEWLALDWDEEWSEVEQREAIARAFAMYGKRGTAEGLREALRVFAGVHAIVEEPVMNTSWWALPADRSATSQADACGCRGGSGCGCGCGGAGSQTPTWQAGENSILGVTTMLVGAHPQGAVVGATATLDQSHLISQEEFGAPLFDEVAHRFTVQLYRSELRCTEKLAEVIEVIEREKPAHTDYHLCIIEPRLRVGFQARVGIDSVVAGAPAVMGLGEGLALGETALGGEPSGTIGERSRVGLTTRVG